jgi:hypothetical protein
VISQFGSSWRLYLVMKFEFEYLNLWWLAVLAGWLEETVRRGQHKPLHSAFQGSRTRCMFSLDCRSSAGLQPNDD